LDVAQRTEMVEAELTRLIEKRSRNGEQDPDEREELWAASVREYNRKRQAELAEQWCAYYERQAQAAETNAAIIAARCRAKAAALMNGQREER
jgi:hypothetical protein